ncbi:MAG TPA: methyltransferase domain-containing protein [bacterium]|nr:methyltransferase domain-containing protein [bacterium]
MKILIFGTGKFFERNQYNRDIADYEIVAFIDNDKSKHGLILNDKIIYSPENIHNLIYDKIIIMSSFAEKIKKQLLDLNIPEEKIIIYKDAALQLKIFLSYFYLRGEGLEIGALHNPMEVNRDVCKVKYVDKKNIDGLISNYSHFNKNELVSVNIVDDGECLNNIQDESQDFIIASHFLEHCKNPLQTIKNHFNKIKKNGILFYVVPDKRFTFDKKRKLTEWQHLYNDYLQLPDQFEHYYEFAALSETEEKKIIKLANRYITEDFSIHFHVRDAKSLLNFFVKTSEMFGFEILNYSSINGELLCILKK